MHNIYLYYIRQKRGIRAYPYLQTKYVDITGKRRNITLSVAKYGLVEAIAKILCTTNLYTDTPATVEDYVTVLKHKLHANDSK